GIEHRDLPVPRVVEPTPRIAAGDGRAVRRPGGSLVAAVAAGQPLGRAAFRVDEEDVPLDLDVPVLLTAGTKRELPPVRRPARRGVLLLAARQPARLARTVARDEPDRRAVIVGLAVDSPRDERHSLAVRRDPRIVGPTQLVDVTRAHETGSKPLQ